MTQSIERLQERAISSDGFPGSWEHLSDEHLVDAFRAGSGPPTNRDLFTEIFRRYHTRVTFWCYRFTRDRELALDLAQDVFLKAFRRFHTFRSDAKLSTWLFTVTRNHCIDALNKRSGEPDTSDVTVLHMADPRALDIASDLERREYVDMMMNVVTSCLTHTEARIMSLHYGHDMPLAAVTGLLGLTNASGAKAYIVSARRKLSRLEPLAVC